MPVLKVKHNGEWVVVSGADTSVQPDWAQNDVTAPDYIKNKTHWEQNTRAIIEWDGNTDGLPCVPLVDGINFYKISDLTPREEDFYGTVQTGLNHRAEITESGQGMMWIADGVLQAGFLYVVTTSDVVIEGIPLNFPSHGIYTLFASGEVPQFSYTEIGSCVIHQLDEKFIPDTIARVSDMPSISGLASEDYVDAKVASIPTPDVSGQINTHNTATDAHNDIREEINAIQSYILSIDYESLLAFDTSEIVIGSLTNTTSVLGQAILGQMVLA